MRGYNLYKFQVQQDSSCCEFKSDRALMITANGTCEIRAMLLSQSVCHGQLTPQQQHHNTQSADSKQT